MQKRKLSLQLLLSYLASMCQCLGHYDKFLQLKSIKLMWNVQLFKPSMNISDGKQNIYLYEHAYYNDQSYRLYKKRPIFDKVGRT